MKIEIQKDIKINGEQLYKVVVDGKTIYSNLSFDELSKLTIGEIDEAAARYFVVQNYIKNI